MNLCKPMLVVAVGLALGGCAVAPKPDTQFLAKPFKVDLAQVAMRDRKVIRSVIALDLPKDSPDIEQQTSEAIDAAQSQAFSDMSKAIAALPGLENGGAPVIVPSELDGLPIADRGRPIAPDVIATLRTLSGADALLRFGISDYGLTPKAWRRSVIAFEVVSTLGIAAIAYVKPATRAVAGAYLFQEAIEETVEAYSGFWVLDEVYRPVRVEAELIDLHTGRRVWADCETGFSDRRLARIYTTVSIEERRAQLNTSLRQAISKIVDNLQKARDIAR